MIYWVHTNISDLCTLMAVNSNVIAHTCPSCVGIAVISGQRAFRSRIQYKRARSAKYISFTLFRHSLRVVVYHSWSSQHPIPIPGRIQGSIPSPSLHLLDTGLRPFVAADGPSDHPANKSDCNNRMNLHKDLPNVPSRTSVVIEPLNSLGFSYPGRTPQLDTKDRMLDKRRPIHNVAGVFAEPNTGWVCTNPRGH